MPWWHFPRFCGRWKHISHRPCSYGACTEKIQKKTSSVYHAGKKAQEGFSNRRDDFWPEVLRMSFKEDRGQWTRPWRKDRHEQAETKVDGWTVVIPDTWTIMSQVDRRWAWHLLEGRVMQFSLFTAASQGPDIIQDKQQAHSRWQFKIRYKWN